MPPPIDHTETSAPQQPGETQQVVESGQAQTATSPTEKPASRGVEASWRAWYEAFRQVWPLYLATRIAFVLLTYLASLFSLQPTPTVGGSSRGGLSPALLLAAWNRWDSAHFTSIATHGYDTAQRAAFFPLFPLLEKGGAWLTGDPFLAGLLIANLAALGLFMALYQLLKQDFGQEIAGRGVLYLAVFPTAFFLAAAYNESLFILLLLLGFLALRRGAWWWAGLFGFLAALTRSAGLLLLVPYCYEYLRQQHFRLNRIRLDSLSLLLVPLGLGVFMLYCAYRFHDPLAFSHAQAAWLRHLSLPWKGFSHAFAIILKRPFLSFDAIHNVIDLGAALFMLLLVLLSLVGPWRFARELRAYALYALAAYLFLLLFPAEGGFPLQSMSRLVLEIFPAFVVLATLGKRATFHLYYLIFAGILLCFLLLQFLAGYWIV